MNKTQRIDLPPQQRQLLAEILQQHMPHKTIWAYGSRVSGQANEGSDLDLVVFDASVREIEHLKDALSESNFLFCTDVMAWEQIPQSFQQTIKQKYTVLQ